MHRARIDRARRNWRRSLRLRLQILTRIGDEFLLASGRAKIIRAAFMRLPILGAMWINRHPAHRIFDVSLGMLVRDVLSMSVVRVSFVNCHGDPTLV